MFGMFRRRWFWGILGAIATTYLVREARQRQSFSRNGNGRMSKRAVDGLLQAGRSVMDRTMGLVKLR